MNGVELHRFAAELRGPTRRALVDAATSELRDAVEQAARRAVGGDLAVGDKGRLGVKIVERGDGAVVIATGPWHLVERPRRGGYPIKPGRKGGALMVGRGVWRAGARGGPIVAPLRPFAKGTDAGRPAALDAMGDVLSRAVARG